MSLFQFGYSLLKFTPFIRQVVGITAFRIHFNVESVSLTITDWTRPQRITARTRAETRVAGSRAQASEFYLGDNVDVLEIPATGVGVKFVHVIGLKFISPDVSCHIVENLDGTLENDVEVLGIIAAGGCSKFVLDIDIPAFEGNTVEDLDEALERLGGDGRGRRPRTIHVGGGRGRSSCAIKIDREGRGCAGFY